MNPDHGAKEQVGALKAGMSKTPVPRPSWLQHAVALGAAVQTARVATRLRRTRDPRTPQHAIYEGLVRKFAATEFGRWHGLQAVTPYPEFQTRVPLRGYEQFAPWIERMKTGEADVLWPGTCSYYAVSSGTTQGRTKFLPVTDDLLRHFRRAGLDSLCLYARRTRSAAIFRGRHLFLGGSTALAPLGGRDAFRAWSGDLSGITALNLPTWADRHLYEPGREIAQMTDWPSKLDAMARRTAGRDVRVLAGIPSWSLVFAEVMRARTGRATLRAVWPRFECFIHGGVPIAPFVGELAEAFGEGVNFHEVYPASEGFIAAQDAGSTDGLRLLTDAGLFYEFLPMSAFEESRLEQLGSLAVPIEEVRTGVDYALVMTTPGGLCRYVIGDVVRFSSTQPPRLVYAGRTRLQLSAFGEHVIEKEVTDALTTVCTRHGLAVANFHVAPVFASARDNVSRGRHEWWIELRATGKDRPAAVVLAQELDEDLKRRNEDYEAKRQGGGLESPLVRLVAEGTFERWLRRHGKWGGQNKMPRCRSDREIADELAEL